MECIKWSKEFNVGFKEIDGQHYKLVSIMNRLCDALDKGEEKDMIAGVLEDLSDYTEEHFNTEEKYFHEFGYEKKDEHMAQHQEFINKVSALKSDLMEGSEKVSSETITFLGQWFAGHVNSMDRDYIECFREHGLS